MAVKGIGRLRRLCDGAIESRRSRQRAGLLLALAVGLVTVIPNVLGARPATAQSGTWSVPTAVDTSALMDVSCGSPKLCAASDLNGDVLTYDGSRWTTPVSLGSRALGVDCSSTFCLAIAASQVATFNGTTWSAPQNVAGGPLGAVSCTSPTFCMAVGVGGDALMYNGTSWSSPTSLGPIGSPDTISCVSPTFCAVTGYEGQAVLYNGHTWSTPVQIYSLDTPTASLRGIACASDTFCVAIDAWGYAIIYNGVNWSAPVGIDVTGDYTLNGPVSCPTPTSCTVVDGQGYAITFDGANWSTPSFIDSATEKIVALNGIACPTTAFCVAVDSGGRYLTYDGNGTPPPPPPPSSLSMLSLSGGGQSGTAVSVAAGSGVAGSVSLSGTNAAIATGVVVYGVYADSACTVVVSEAGEKVFNGSVPDSFPIPVWHVGTYYWKAMYLGDAYNAPSSTGCDPSRDIETVTPASTSMTTSLSDGVQRGLSITVQAAKPATDTATLMGTAARFATGTITYAVYSDSACTIFANPPTTVAITSTGYIPSVRVVLSSPGSYYWQASYSGDSSNYASASTCGPEGEVETVLPALGVQTSRLPDAVRRANYRLRLQAMGATARDKWSIIAGTGTLPGGLRLSHNGLLSGRPKKSDRAGSYHFTVEVASHKTSGHAAQAAATALTLTLL